MHQIFLENVNGKVKYEIDADGEFVPKNHQANVWLSQMSHLCEHSDNPMTSQHMLNVEDKTCFFYKHIAITHDVKSPTKRIPYNWIFPMNFDLSKDPTGKIQLNGYSTQHLWDENFLRTPSLLDLVGS